ncbi:MAG: FecR domain-containing protein [Planctomycetota bacterium]
MTIPDHIQKGIQAYYAERASREQIALLEQWFREDEANVRVFAEHGLVEWHMLCEHEKQDAAAIMSVIRESKDSELDVLGSGSDYFSAEDFETQSAAALNKKQYLAAMSYVFRHTFTPRRIAVLGTAAVLALGVTLSAVLMLGQNRNDQQAGTFDPVDRVVPESNTTVTERPVAATLLHSVDARWRDGRMASLSVPQGLRAGRHDLLEGLVELGLSKGVRVVLEAPATFELTEQNRVVLSNGRLVASVPPSGHGFTVVTPAAQIIDYGTEFGVESAGGSETRVQVFDGEVGIAARRSDAEFGEQVLLREREAAVVELARGDVERVDFDGTAFERRVVRRLDVVDIVAGGDGRGLREGNGIDLSSGEYFSTQEMARRDYDQWSLMVGQQTHAVASSELVDSVFVLDRLKASARITSRGDRFGGFPVMTSGKQPNDGFGFIQATAAGVVAKPDAMADFSGAFASARRPELEGRSLLIHGGSGVTLDLAAIRRQQTTGRQHRFAAHALSIESLNRAQESVEDLLAVADIWVIIDGEPRFHRDGISTKDGVIDIDVPLNQEDRFLSLVVSHGGDGIGQDWVLIGQPVIEVRFDDLSTE